MGGRIIGYARSAYSNDQFRSLVADAVRTAGGNPAGDPWDRFASRLHFVCPAQGGFAELAKQSTRQRRFIYLATPPSALLALAQELAGQQLVDGAHLIIEKPLGHDLASFRELNRGLREYFDERQLYRIDHSLGKETVHNILAFRFANSVFERLWNRDAIEHVQITVAEEIGVEGRGNFFDEVGTLRDVIQNHAMQLLSLLTMEPPASLDAEAIRNERVKVLRAVQRVDPSAVVRAQYDSGRLAAESVPGFRDEAGVRRGSDTETFVALRLRIENSRWTGVPFYLRAGKRLPRRATEVFIGFRSAPTHLFERADLHTPEPDHLVLRILPHEGISFSFLARELWPEIRLEPATMDYSYSAASDAHPADAFGRVLQAALAGDHTAFARADEVDRAWEILQPALYAPQRACSYAPGTWGPTEADALIAPREWHLQ